MGDDDKPTSEGMRAKRDYSYGKGSGIIYDADPEWARRYDQLAEYVLRADDELSRKNRELIIIAFAAAKDNPEACRNHIAAALKYGSSFEEIVQTIELASRIGGAWVTITAGKALVDLDKSIENLDVPRSELEEELAKVEEVLDHGN